jgi:acetyl-CoA carboxylase carboxyltransferase component
VERFFDPGAFHELELWAQPIKTGYEIDEKFAPADAAVIGYGEVDGRTVMVYAHDYTVHVGSQSAIQHAKVTKVMDTSAKMGVPYVGIVDCAGIRQQDSLGVGPKAAIDGMGTQGTGCFMYSPSWVSGVVPQISIMLGPQFAGSSYSPILSDFLIMRRGADAHMALISPGVIKEVTGAEVTYEEIGGAKVHSEVSGTCDLVVDSDEEGLEKGKKLLSFLPSNWREKPPVVDTGDDPERRDEELLDLVPLDLSQEYDMYQLISRIVDNGDFFEIKPVYAKNAIIGFARLGGQSVGIVANNPMVMRGAIDVNSSDKMARFIRTCDAFNVPLIFLADTVGYLPSAEQERIGLERHAAKVMHAICEATVPKVTIYLRNSSGWGDLAMGTGQMGVDLVLAWPNAQVGRMDPEAAVNVIYAKEIDAATNPEEVRQRRIKEFVERYNNVYYAGARVLIQDIIDPRDTRPMLIKALGWFADKKEDRPWKKHGNIPL